MQNGNHALYYCLLFMLVCRSKRRKTELYLSFQSELVGDSIVSGCSHLVKTHFTKSFALRNLCIYNDRRIGRKKDISPRIMENCGRSVSALAGIEGVNRVKCKKEISLPSPCVSVSIDTIVVFPRKYFCNL